MNKKTLILLILLLQFSCFVIIPNGNMPVIHKFLTDPSTINIGETTWLVWNVLSYNNLTLYGPNFKTTDVTNFPISQTNFQAGIVTPFMTKPYVLKASNDFGAVYAYCYVMVKK